MQMVSIRVPYIDLQNTKIFDPYLFGFDTLVSQMGAEVLKAGRCEGGVFQMQITALTGLLRNGNQMHKRLVIAIHPRPAEGKIRARPLLKPKNVSIPIDHHLELVGAKVYVIKSGNIHLDFFLSSFRITSFRPDQTASTAQTLTSTRPIGKHISRIVSSVISVSTLEAFFGQLTQI